MFKHFPLGEDVVYLIGVLHEKGTVAKDVLGKGADAAWLELMGVARLAVH